ncbi:MAG: hypothetical protein OXF11_15405 [Deltaproteobacteria bacterium]|nr:hypothetical protein [Deltaproteobacteria bacterium]
MAESQERLIKTRTNAIHREPVALESAIATLPQVRVTDTAAYVDLPTGTRTIAVEAGEEIGISERVDAVLNPE